MRAIATQLRIARAPGHNRARSQSPSVIKLAWSFPLQRLALCQLLSEAVAFSTISFNNFLASRERGEITDADLVAAGTIRLRYSFLFVRSDWEHVMLW